MKDVLISLRRTPYQSFAAFLVLFFTLFLSSILLVSIGFLYSLLGYVETRPQVTVYFQIKAVESDIFKVRDELTSSGKVLSVKYVSKEEAFKTYKELNKDNPLLLEMVTSDILPPSLEVYAKQPSYLPEIAEFLKKQVGVDEVNFPKDITNRLVTLTGIVRKIAIGFFVYLIIMSIVVLTTTTLFKVSLKKDEIELLQLLGASNSYIVKPFLFEGILLGLSVSFTVILLVLAIFYYLLPFLVSYFRGIDQLALHMGTISIKVWPVNLQFFSIVFGLMTGFGILIAIIANLIAIKKHIK